MDFDEIMERVGDIVESYIGRKPFDKDIANALGMKPTQYSNRKKANSIPYEEILSYCAQKRISSSWVFFEQSSRMLDENTDEIFKVKLLEDINGSAGGGAFNDEYTDTRYLSLDKTYTDMLGIKENDKIEAIKVIGDSMESTLKDGAIILIDRNKTDITGGGVFVVNTPNGVSVKRLMMNSISGIDLISDNKVYLPQTIAAEDVIVIGKVIGALEKI